MLHLSLKLCAAPSPATTEQLTLVLTGLAAHILGRERSQTSVAVEYLPASRWTVGGVPVAALGCAAFFLEVTVCGGTTSRDERADCAERLCRAVAATLGAVDPSSGVVINEVCSGAWSNAASIPEHRYRTAGVSP